MQAELETLRLRLAREAQAVDRAGTWSEETVAALRVAGALGWAVPREQGGAALSAREQVEAYEAVARGSMTAALILTQHDGACQFLAKSQSAALRDELLPRCARGELLATVGISHLTTSNRLGGAALRAATDGDGWRLDGRIPWVTSVPHCGLIVAGATLADGRQILAALRAGAAGMRVGDVPPLVALQAAATCEVSCDAVRIEAGDVIRGPSENVLKRRASVKSLTVSATGIGHAAAMAEMIRPAAEGGSAAARSLIDEFEQLRERVRAAAVNRSEADGDAPRDDIRPAMNALVSRFAAAMLTISKGSGMLLDHPAQRLAREAMFFLVWSASAETREATVALLAGKQ